jgi:hypothetical protein
MTNSFTTLNCHLDRRAHGPDGPPKWMKNRCCGLPRTCHLDRSVPGFPTSLHLTTATNAALSKEGRTHLTGHATLDRKSGGAEWRDLRSPFLAERVCFSSGAPGRVPHVAPAQPGLHGLNMPGRSPFLFPFRRAHGPYGPPKWMKNPYIISHPLHQSFPCPTDRSGGICSCLQG